ncbi:MAG: alpha/beta fold hydrolase, partial [Planctomycetota bacterium]
MSVHRWSRRRRLVAVLLALYLVLLAASHAVRALRPPGVPVLGPMQSAIELPVIQGGQARGERARVVYEDHRSKDLTGDAPTVVLLHGSPGSLGSVRGLIPHLTPTARVLAVDLPGFGKSELDVPDYGFDAHAGYVFALLDALEIKSAHLLGFSMGGGVILECARQAPTRVDSITLLAAIGVQELELLGSYHLNHAVHGLQVAAFWFGTHLFPHFGRLDAAFFGLPYARNFYDSDQRPLREVLETLEQPTLVVHSPSDPLVPIEAAREHARIVPQAELVELSVEGPTPGSEPEGIEGHLLPIREADRVGPILADFVARVEAGAATRRADASIERQAAAERPFESVPLESMGLLIAMFLIAAATLVSEDLTCIATGALVAQGRIDLAAGAFACFAGIYIGDLLLFLTGRLAGARALKVPPLTWVLDDRTVERAAHWFERRGLSAIFLTRFMPGTRLPTYFAAGALRTNAVLFAVYFLLAAGIWTPILVWLSSLIGGNLQENVALFEEALPLGLLATVVIGLVIVKVVVPAATWRGRRQLAGSYLRKRHWEFWPPWVFYPPVVFYVLYRGVRAGSLTAFTACNPAIPHGGFIGESKRAILEGLSGAGEALPAWTLVPAGDDRERRRQALIEFVEGPQAPGFPLVLKPDVGQRGSGVVVAKSLERALEYVCETDIALIAQAYLEGAEFG